MGLTFQPQSVSLQPTIPLYLNHPIYKTSHPRDKRPSPIRSSDSRPSKVSAARSCLGHEEHISNIAAEYQELLKDFSGSLERIHQFGCNYCM
jgi:hypothetical protein